MKKSFSKKQFIIGSKNVEKRMAQATSSVTLESLKPSERAINLVRSMVTGELSSKDALSTLRDYYANEQGTQ